LSVVPLADGPVAGDVLTQVVLAVILTPYFVLHVVVPVDHTSSGPTLGAGNDGGGEDGLLAHTHIIATTTIL